MNAQKILSPQMGEKPNSLSVAKYPQYNDFLDKFSYKQDDFEVSPDEWLIDSFLEMKSVSVIYAPSKQGKSFFAQSFIFHDLQKMDDKIFIYLDNDNSAKTAKKRKFNEMIEKYPNFKYIGKKKIYEAKTNMIDILLNIEPKILSKCIIVLDSLRNFVKGDMKDSQLIKQLMEKFERLRDLGATLIILHHSTKSDARIFSGAEDIRASAENMIFLENLLKNTKKQKDFKDKFYFKLSLEHSRNNDEDEKFFYANAKSGEFRECDKMEVYKMVLPEICFKARIILEEKGDLIQRELYEHLGCTNNNSKRKELEQGIDILYERYETGEKNAKAYTIIS